MIDENKLARILGASNVSRETATLSEYAADTSLAKPIKPDYVVRPQNARDIAKLVKLANETLTPLVPLSSGPPHFRGDTVPGIGGAVVVDLSKMKQIIRIDRMNRVAMVEPGVTFAELIPAVAKEGLRLNLPLLPRKSKSVVGSMLEREPVIMPKYHWDISDPIACVEVIFGTGEMFRTGSAAGPGTIGEQWAVGGSQKEPGGPGQVSWHRVIQGAQGTMGIVTWASLRCEILPSVEEPFLVGAKQLDKLMELAHWLNRLQMVNECFILNNTNLATIMARKFPAEYQEIKESLPPWVLFFNIAGYEYLPEKRVSYLVKDMTDIAQRVGLEPAGAVGRVPALELLKAVQRPSREPYWKLRPQGGFEDILFITINDKLPGLVSSMNDMADEAGYAAAEMGVYIQPIVQGVNCHGEFTLFYDPKNQSQCQRVRKLATGSINSLMAKGAFFSRPYGEAAEIIINRDAASVAALKKVKGILDPNNVMNPGKLCF